MAKKKQEWGPYFVDDDTENDFEYRDVTTARGTFGVPAGYKMRFGADDQPEYIEIGINAKTPLIGEEGYKGKADDGPGGIKVVKEKK